MTLDGREDKTMKHAAAALLLILALATPARAHPLQEHAFRTVAFICATGRNGTALRTVENIRGERILYKITYLDSLATMFTISRARDGRSFRQVTAIDLRGALNRKELALALTMSADMEVNSDRYCQGGQTQIDAREQLLANHEFNRESPAYRGH